MILDLPVSNFQFKLYDDKKEKWQSIEASVMLYPGSSSIHEGGITGYGRDIPTAREELLQAIEAHIVWTKKHTEMLENIAALVRQGSPEDTLMDLHLQQKKL